MALLTHPLLDAQTTWGTQLFWPFHWRVAIENAIIDPIYTLPFLIHLILTAFQDKQKKVIQLPRLNYKFDIFTCYTAFKE